MTTRLVLPALLLAALLVVVALPQTTGQQISAANGITNGGFEDGLDGWDVSAPSGVADTTSSVFGFTAQEGAKFAYVEVGNQDVFISISQEFTAVAGATISGYVFFNDNDYPNYCDIGQLRLLQNSSVVQTFLDMDACDDGGANSATPWLFWEYTFPSGGTYILEARVANVLDDGGGPTAVGLDAVTLTAPPTPTPTVTATAHTRERVNVGGAAGAVAAAISDQAQENRERAAATAILPAATVQPPRTGTGVTISPPNTGDAGLAGSSSLPLAQLAALSTGLGLALTLRRLKGS